MGSEAEVVRHHFAWYRSAVRTVTLRAQARFLERDPRRLQRQAGVDVARAIAQRGGAPDGA